MARVNTNTATPPDMTAQEPAGHENRAAAAARARGIREAVTGAIRLTAAEQERAAENLWNILAEAERRGARKAAVLERAGLGGPGSSTKYLGRYARNPDPATRPAKGEALTKTASKYLRIAEAAGEMAGQDRDLFVAALFNGTRFASAGDVVTDEDVHAEFSSLLRSVCAGVVRRHDLARVFRHCAARNLVRLWFQLHQCREGRWADLWDEFGDGMRVSGLIDEDSFWGMPYPSILVGWGRLDTGASYFAHVGDPEAGTTAPTASTTAEIVLEVRLALMPLGPGGAVEPAFVSSPWTVMSPDSGVPAGGWPHPCAHRGFPKVVRYGDTSWIRADEPDGAACARFAGSEPGLDLRNSYASTFPARVDLVSPGSCRRLLELPVSGWTSGLFDEGFVTDDLDPALLTLDTKRRDDRWPGINHDRDPDLNSAKWRSTPGTLGERLEHSLLYARGDRGAPPFDEVLDRACGRAAAEITDLVRAADTAREEEKTRLLARWDAPDGPPLP